MGNLKVAGLDIGSHNLTIDEPSGTLLVDGKEVSGGIDPNENIELSAGNGVIMTSENGTRYKLYIDNDGRITTEAI